MDLAWLYNKDLDKDLRKFIYSTLRDANISR
jgi:hypothetical protein